MPILVIGHAAAGGEAPENTLAGVRACIDASADAMEIDVQITSDGVPILMHDTTVDRTTNRSGAVRTLPFEALSTADAGGGEPVPSLDRVLTAVNGRFTVMCELKATPGEAEHDQRVVDAVVAVIREHKAETWAAIHSFNPEMVARSRATAPEISAAIISGPVLGAEFERLLSATVTRNAQAVSMHHSCLNGEAVRKARQRQLTVWAWTADQPEDWRKLVAAGVAGIITNRPHALRDYLDQQ